MDASIVHTWRQKEKKKDASRSMYVYPKKTFWSSWAISSFIYNFLLDIYT